MAKDNLNYNPTLDEIVFEHRNKEYGAYDLRSTYSRLLTKSFLIGTAFFLLLAVSPLIYLKIQQMNARDAVEVKADLVNILEEEPIIEQPKEEEPPPPPPPKEEEKQEVIQNVVPEPKKAPKIETPPPPITKQLETTTGLQNQEGVKTPTYTPPPPPPGTGKVVTAEVKVNTNEVYDSVDQSAEYPGGMSALRRFLGENFDTSLFDGGEGQMTAKLKFVVERDGSVSDVKITQKSGNGEFDNEAIRVVKKLKKWSPGKKNGESVRSYYSVPFTMVIQ